MTNGKSKGYVYVLTNEAMPGLVKVGRSVFGGESRATQIYQTGVPLPFKLYFEMIFEDVIAGELTAHDGLSEYRVNNAREFFKVSPEEAAKQVVRAWAIRNGGSLVSLDFLCETVTWKASYNRERAALNEHEANG